MRLTGVIEALSRAHRDCVTARACGIRSRKNIKNYDRAAKSLARVNRAIISDSALTKSYSEIMAKEIVDTMEECLQRRAARREAENE